LGHVYIDSRATLTAEFKMLMPEMNAFVASWLPDGMTVAVAEAQMAVACEAVLGYAQPVERKDLGEGVAGSDASDIDDAGGG